MNIFRVLCRKSIGAEGKLKVCETYAAHAGGGAPLKNFHILGAIWCMLRPFSKGIAYLSLLKINKHILSKFHLV